MTLAAPFDRYRFMDMPDDFEALLAEAAERLVEQVTRHDRAEEIIAQLDAKEPFTGLSYQELNLLNIVLRAIKSKDPRKTINSAITGKKIDKWLEARSYAMHKEESFIPTIGEERKRRVTHGEVTFQWRQRYHVSEVERWIRPSIYKPDNEFYGRRIGEELALIMERELGLSEDEGNWLAADFMTADRSGNGYYLVYHGSLKGYPLEVKVLCHEGERLDRQHKTIINTMPLLRAALNQVATAQVVLLEVMADTETKDLRAGISVDLTNRHGMAETGYVSFAAVMEEVNAKLHVKRASFYHILSIDPENPALNLTAFKANIERQLKPAARGSEKNRRILEKRKSREHALDECPVTEELLQRVQKWDPDMARQVRAGEKTSIEVPAQVVEGIASASPKGKHVKIKFSYSGGRIRSNLRINDKYQWIRSGLYGPGTFTETVMAGMVGRPAEEVFQHPFSSLVGPVSSVRSYRDTNVIRFRLKDRSKSEA